MIVLSRPGRPVAVVGGCGAVGRAALRQLRDWGLGPLRVGARNPGKAARCVRDVLDGDGDFRRVDVADNEELDRFCDGARIIVNCAGPAHEILDRVARAAARAGLPYVDASGDGDLYERVGFARGPVAVLSAGLIPGLSGLLPRYLAGREFARCEALTLHTGGCDRFTATAAHDYVTALTTGYGVPYTYWRHGRRVSTEPVAQVGLVLPGFDRPVTAIPFLSTETERVARVLTVTEARSFTVFDGEGVLTALSRLTPDDSGSVGRTLQLAAELDLFGRTRYQTLLVHLTGLGADDSPRVATVTLRAQGASEATGVVVALAVQALDDGSLPGGTHHFAEVVDPDRMLHLLRTASAIHSVEVTVDTPGERSGDASVGNAAGPVFDEGVL
ncbi:MAG: saccharopine dehydrogenase NADP-binding domain-containing protein [Actinobacteria bacterium]|nr:saccharopine dehydrogenase NADP-binding domain-containing protein [Actinomycetota bacterium]